MGQISLPIQFTPDTSYIKTTPISDLLSSSSTIRICYTIYCSANRYIHPQALVLRTMNVLTYKLWHYAFTMLLSIDLSSISHLFYSIPSSRKRKLHLTRSKSHPKHASYFTSMLRNKLIYLSSFSQSFYLNLSSRKRKLHSTHSKSHPKHASSFTSMSRNQYIYPLVTACLS